jgi:DNA-binding IclR family transcriptional regulator
VIDNGLKRYTENTIVEPDKLRAELASIRDRGYANYVE